MNVVGSPRVAAAPAGRARAHRLLRVYCKVKGHKARRQHAELLKQRNHTARPPRYTGALDEGGNIMPMHTLRIKANDRPLLGPSPDHAPEVDVGQLLLRVSEQYVLLPADLPLAY